MIKSIRLAVAVGLLGVPVSGALAAQASRIDFPNRPVRYIVPFPPGGSTDIVARVVADALSRDQGQQFVIDNRGGASGTIGADIAAHATPDGYTLFACNIASLAVSPALYRNLNYNPDKDFAPVGLIGSNPNALAVHPAVPAKSVAEFVDLAKSRPGKLNYSSAGAGTSPQLSMEMFKMKAGLDILHVPYKGGGPALIGLIGAEVQAMFGTAPSLLGAIRAGQIRPLAVTSTTRSPDLPDVPTLVESGMPDFEVISWQGLCTPSGVPRRILAVLRTGLAKVLASPQTRKHLSDQGVQTTPLEGEKFRKFFLAERAKYRKVVKDVGIPLR